MMGSSQVCLDYNINNCALTGQNDSSLHNVNEQSELVWISCKKCFMYLLTDQNHLLYISQQSQCSKNDPLQTICNKCTENDSLHKEITELKNTIDEQCERIDKLREINDLEAEIDIHHDTMNNGVDDITNGIEILELTESVSAQTDSESNAQVAQNGTVTAISNGKNTKNTSNSADSSSSATNILENTQNNYNNSDKSVIFEPDKTADIEMSKDSAATQDEVRENVHSQRKQSAEVLLIGNKRITGVDLTQETLDMRKVLKISYPIAKVKQIEENAKFFLTKQCTNAKIIITHIGENDIANKSSVQLQNDFQSLASTIKGLNKKLVISGPIPHPRLNTEKFSRLLNLHEWLLKWTEENSIQYVNNFDTFWQRNQFFSPYSDQLSKYGYETLSNQIKTCLKNLS